MARFRSCLLLICSVLVARGSKVLVHLQEMCQDETLDEDGFMQFLERKSEILPGGVELQFLERDVVCNGGSGLRALLAALSSPAPAPASAADTRALVVSVPHDACSLLSRAARLHGTPLVSWTCPQDEPGVGVVPSLRQVGGAVVAAVEMLKCKNAIIISEGTSPWSLLANKVESGLIKIRVTSRLFLWDSAAEPADKLTFVQRVKNTNIKAIIICSSYHSAVTADILKAFDKQEFHPSVALITDMYDLILPLRTSYRPRRDKPTPIQLLEIRSRKLLSTITKSSFPNVYLRNNSYNKNSVENLKEKYNTEKNFDASDFNIVTSKYLMSKTFLNDNKKDITRSSTLLLIPNITKVNFRISTKKVLIKNNEQTSESKPMGTNMSDPDPQTMSSKGCGSRPPVGPSPGSSPVTVATATKPKPRAGSKGEVFSLHGDKRQTSAQLLKVNKKQYVALESYTTVRTKEELHRFHTNQDAETKTVDVVKVGKSRNFHQVHLARTKKRHKLTDKDNKLFKSFSPSKTVINSNTLTEVKDNSYRRVKKSARRSLDDFSLGNLSSKMYDSIIIMKCGNYNKESELRDKVFKYLLESLFFICNNCSRSVDHFHYVFYRLFPLHRKDMNLKWELLMNIEEHYNSQLGNISRNITIVKEWLMVKGPGVDADDCEGGYCLSGNVSATTAHIIAILAGSLAMSTVVAAFGLTMRNVLLRKRLSKGPNKIVLLANDFVFPQVAESRRVDEGMEAMLCCWLQQLQGFGGPEVEKPDLLKGSVGSLKGLGIPGSATKVPSSNGSIAKSNHFADIRTKYNGDLVQMKYIPNVGTFELKSKATDILVVMHGLRHENINPFIGCLCEPSKPALVFEYCSRGSLEDVLVADEIKLDWTFRLSLLTDLVRGMRYLHGSGGAVRAHGRLSSRSCVVDARWVLKVTDYGLPAFYDAQGVPPAAVNNRDLLWTAPELLRAGCMQRGTAAGDVYSFAIIMQEVVVRGEPFCMLALTPDEIIEKIKKPPPLIRPSVSKGAAPPEAINIMRQCWTEQPDLRPDFNTVHDLFRKLNHGRKVNLIDTMFQMLEKYSNNLEELIRERTEQLDMEKKKTEQLLNRMLPSSVADKLKLGMPVDPEAFADVSIYFSDIVGFTAISANSSPLQVVDLLNDLYTCFDATINAYNVYKVETIGDAYMVVGGLPVRASDHAEQVATMALDLLHHSGRFRIRHLPATPLHLRIGLHTGPCCAGVIGLTMPRYCLFGDTVNTASRMESTGAAWRIHLSQTTRDKLEAAGGYQLEYRGLTEIKGKGRMHTYWLLGKHGFDKPLPTPPPLGDNQSLEDLLIVEQGAFPVSNSLLRSDDRSSDSASGGELSPRAGTSGLHTERDRSLLTSPDSQSDKPSQYHFSIDRSFFNVEPQSTQQVIEQRKKNYQIRQEEDKNGFKLNSEFFKKENRTKSQHITDTVVEIEPADGADVEHCGAVKSEAVQKNSIDKLALNHKLSIGLSLCTPVSASEVAAALLGTSTTSQVCNRYKDVPRFKRSTLLEETDLSKPYNHYRCLSPSESNLTHAGKSSSLSLDAKPATGRFLKRQFSLDRDDSSGADGGTNSRTQPRLFKQNSAGAANDLERIEEIPLQLNSPGPYRHRKLLESSLLSSSMSISSESLTDSKLFISSKGNR